MMKPLQPGHWLGIDIGSSRAKICSFCLIVADGAGQTSVTFEKGPAEAPYPEKNSFKALIDPSRAPTYLKSDVEDAVCRVLAGSQLVERWLAAATGPGPAAVAVDAPVAWASAGSKQRRTEAASTDTFSTPPRAIFEGRLDGSMKPGFYNSNTFWKCVGFTVYRWLARRLVTDLPTDVAQETLAAWTCSHPSARWRVRETFPSDVYKRANSRHPKTEQISRLGDAAFGTLHRLVANHPWLSAWPKGHAGAVSMAGLEKIRRALQLDCDEGIERSCEMRKRSGPTGDLWDAFTCAYAACCEDHGGAYFHGWDGHSTASEEMLREGAILTVATAD